MPSPARSSRVGSSTTPPERAAPRPDWLTAALPAGSIVDAERLGWGFSHDSWRVDVDDGRSVVVTRFPTASRASDVAGRLRGLRPRLGAVGIPVPGLVAGLALDPTVVVTAFVEGIVGAACLDQAAGPELVGGLMGSAVRAFGEVDLGGVALPLSWSSADGLAAAEQGGELSRALAQVDSDLRPEIAALVIRARHLLADRPARFVHGDFAPVNAILRDDRLAALVDLEHASRGDPLFDAAWFRWIVAYHHPAIAPRVWEAFRVAAGFSEVSAPDRGLLRDLPVLGILERLASAASGRDPRAAASVEHWRSMLRAIVARGDSGGARPTPLSSPSG